MQADIIEQWTDYGANAFTSLKELGEISTKTAEKLTEQQFDFISSCYDKGVKQMSLISNGASAFTSLKELGEINTKTAEKLTEQQFDFISSCYDKGVKQVSLISESNGYKDLLAGQTSLAAEYNELLMDNLRKAADLMNESREEIATWFEKGVATFTTPPQKGGRPSKPLENSSQTAAPNSAKVGSAKRPEKK